MNDFAELIFLFKKVHGIKLSVEVQHKKTCVLFFLSAQHV